MLKLHTNIQTDHLLLKNFLSNIHKLN